MSESERVCGMVVHASSCKWRLVSGPKLDCFAAINTELAESPCLEVSSARRVLSWEANKTDMAQTKCLFLNGECVIELSPLASKLSRRCVSRVEIGGMSHILFPETFYKFKRDKDNFHILPIVSTSACHFFCQRLHVDKGGGGSTSLHAVYSKTVLSWHDLFLLVIRRRVQFIQRNISSVFVIANGPCRQGRTRSVRLPL